MVSHTVIALAPAADDSPAGSSAPKPHKKRSHKTKAKSKKAKSAQASPALVVVTTVVPENEPESESTRLVSSQELPILNDEKPAPKKRSLLKKRRKRKETTPSVNSVAEPAAEPPQQPQDISPVLASGEVSPVEAPGSAPVPECKPKRKKSSKKKKRSQAEKPRRRKKKRSCLTDPGDELSDEEDPFSDQLLLDIDEHEDYACLTEADIIAEQTKEIQEVAEILSVREEAAITLLKHFKWNREQLMAQYFDQPQRVLEAAGVSDEAVKPPSAAPVQAAQENEEGAEVECSICCMDVAAAEMYALPACSHAFCLECWDMYLTLQINEGEAFAHCAHLDCKSLVPEEEVKKLVALDTYQKYCAFFMASFVDNNANFKWCPAPGCGNAVTSDMIKGKTVTCRCGYRFCFQCSEEAHQPASCGQLRQWKKKCQDESETNNWIIANTQECPKCAMPTEKNGGCNHMTCRQCKHEYCWVCNKDWKGHNDFYSCNRFSKSKDEKKSSKKSSRKEREQQRLETRRALEKYLHYHSRFANHARSNELEQTNNKAMKLMRQMEETEATGAEVLFIQLATQKLREVRSVLKYSYVVRYYMEEEDHNTGLLEYLQEDLEKTAEQLSESLHQPMKNKMEVVNLTAITETRLRNMVDATDKSL